ncbi:MAG: hypothetical protein ACYDAI_14725 [Trichloromonadaceae bacterium]
MNLDAGGSLALNRSRGLTPVNDAVFEAIATIGHDIDDSLTGQIEAEAVGDRFGDQGTNLMLTMNRAH